MCSRIFKNKSGTFSFNLKNLEQNQNKCFVCSRVFSSVFPGLCYTLTASTDILRDIFRPLTASNTSQGLYPLSRPLLTLSQPLQTLSQPLKHSQGLCSLQALSWLVIENSQELSHGCESVVKAVRVFYTLAASLGSPTITMDTLTAFISTLAASTDTFMASTTLTRPLQTLSRLKSQGL
jgi:hypothetical protein